MDRDNLLNNMPNKKHTVAESALHCPRHNGRVLAVSQTDGFEGRQ